VWDFYPRIFTLPYVELEQRLYALQKKCRLGINDNKKNG
jgi:hypothetical protein